MRRAPRPDAASVCARRRRGVKIDPHRVRPRRLRLRATPRLPAGASRYGWFVGVVAVLLIAYISVNTVRTRGVGSARPAPGVERCRRSRRRWPPARASTATSTSRRKAGQGGAGKRPACYGPRPRCPELVRPRARRGPSALAFLATRGAQCTRRARRPARATRAPSRRDSRRRRDPRRSRRPARAWCAATAGASRSAGTATASWRTSSAWPSARSHLRPPGGLVQGTERRARWTARRSTRA